MFGPLTAIALMSAPSAHAVEVSWDGHYRTAFRTFNSLSLSDENGNPNSEEGSWWADHKLRLAPAFRLSEHVSLYTEVDVLPLVPWGQQPVTINDPITGEEWPGVYAQVSKLRAHPTVLTARRTSTSGACSLNSTTSPRFALVACQSSGDQEWSTTRAMIPSRVRRHLRSCPGDGTRRKVHPSAPSTPTQRIRQRQGRPQDHHRCGRLPRARRHRNLQHIPLADLRRRRTVPFYGNWAEAHLGGLPRVGDGLPGSGVTSPRPSTMSP